MSKNTFFKALFLFAIAVVAVSVLDPHSAFAQSTSGASDPWANYVNGVPVSPGQEINGQIVTGGSQEINGVQIGSSAGSSGGGGSSPAPSSVGANNGSASPSPASGSAGDEGGSGVGGGAGAATFGALLCNAVENTMPFGLVFQWVAYVSGVMAAIKGVHGLKLHADDPRTNKINIPLMYLFGSMCLLALPDFVGMLENTLYTPSAGGTLSCNAGNVVQAFSLEGVLTNFVANIGNPMFSLVSLTAILSGLFMIVKGLIKASKYGTDPKTHSLHSVLTHLGFGALLMTVGDNLNILVGSLFGTDTSPLMLGGNIDCPGAISAGSALSWSKMNELVGGSGVSCQFINAVSSALMFVQIIGAIAFVRGWLVLKKFVEGGGNVTLTQGLTHIIGGCLAINIGGFLTLMDATFGTNLLAH